MCTVQNCVCLHVFTFYAITETPKCEHIMPDSGDNCFGCKWKAANFNHWSNFIQNSALFYIYIYIYIYIYTRTVLLGIVRYTASYVFGPLTLYVKISSGMSSLSRVCFGLQTSTKNSSLHGFTSSAAAVSVSSPVSFLAFDCSHHVIRLTHDSP